MNREIFDIFKREEKQGNRLNILGKKDLIYDVVGKCDDGTLEWIIKILKNRFYTEELKEKLKKEDEKEKNL